jgi:hypothetical protein
MLQENIHTVVLQNIIYQQIHLKRWTLISTYVFKKNHTLHFQKQSSFL